MDTFLLVLCPKNCDLSAVKDLKHTEASPLACDIGGK